MDSDQGKLFIGGISWETTEERLADYFKVYGDVAETVIMKDRATGRARGFGFVVFADPTVADRVLLEKHTIDGRVVEAKKAVPRDEQQNFSRSNSTNPMSGGQIRTKKIFVGGLAPTVTEEDFKTYFEQFGNITDVVVMYDHNTQRPRGFGFITFDSEDAVDRVLQKPFHELREKMVEVKPAIPKELSTGRPATTGFGAGAGRGAAFGGYGQGYSSSPGSGYAPRVDNRYATAAPGRGAYPSYGPGGYVTGGYGTGGGYGPPMNGSYGPSGFTGGAGYATSAGYGGTPTGTGFGAPGATGYVTAPSGARSPWGGNGGSGFPSGGSPAGYGANPAGYGANAGGGMSGYAGTGWVSGGAAQPTGVSTGYGSSAPVYGSGESGYGPAASGYGARGGAPAAATVYGDAYTGSGYGDSAWRPGVDSHTSPASGSAPGAAAYGMGGGAPADAPTNETANFGGAYGVTGRQTQRGPDTRFRPYPTANEHTT